jgi:hypothetical protein
MEKFSFGFLSVVFAVGFPLLYFIGYQARRLGAWSKRQTGPGDRVGFFLVVAVLFGFIAGSLIQPLWDRGVACKSNGQLIIPCVFGPNERG